MDMQLEHLGPLIPYPAFGLRLVFAGPLDAYVVFSLMVMLLACHTVPVKCVLPSDYYRLKLGGGFDIP